MKEYQNYVNGKWVSSKTRKTFDSLNPATEKSLGAFQLSAKEDVHEAIRAAEKALPKWSGTPAPKRAEYLFEISRLLKKK